MTRLSMPAGPGATMRAAVYHGQGDVRIEDVPVPEIGDDELLVEVTGAGICGTDAHEFAHGPAMFPIATPHPVTGHHGPMIPGHEFAGRVVAIGRDVTGFEVDDAIVTGAGISCGDCFQCRRGRTNLCEHYATLGLQRDGGLAQYCAVPASTCSRVTAESLPEDVLALTQPLAIAVHTTRRGRLEAGEDVVVIGVGGIGAFITYVCTQFGARVLAVDVDASRLDIAKALGAAHVAEAGQIDLARHVQSAGMRPTIVFEASGSSRGLSAALDAVVMGGRIVLVGFQKGTPAVDLRSVSLREIELIGTNAHVCATDLPEALRLLAARRDSWSDVAPLVLSLDRLVEEGLVPLAEGRSSDIKILIDPRGSDPRPSRM